MEEYNRISKVVFADKNTAETNGRNISAMVAEFFTKGHSIWASISAGVAHGAMISREQVSGAGCT
jgi:hypothetical protein